MVYQVRFQREKPIALTGQERAWIVAAAVGDRRVTKPAHWDEVLVSETRAELKGSIVAWAAFTAASAFAAIEFAGRAHPFGLTIWSVATSGFVASWLAGWIVFMRRPPSERDILALWIPTAKAGMTLCNLVTAGAVWVFLPAADPDQRALLFVLFAWFLIIQFAAATEATQVLGRAVLLVLGSLAAWLLVQRPPHFLELAGFLLLFGASLTAIRGYVRRAVIDATLARAAAEAAQRDLAAALGELERERDARTHFIRAASHDLQQPLQAAALFLDRIGPDADGEAQALGGVKRSLGMARTLVAAMLDHLKLEAGAIKADMTDQQASAIFERVLLTQGPAAIQAGVEIRVSGGGVALHADPLLLARAVENLVANAIRHSGARRVLLGARRRSGAGEIWVIDDGRGLSASDEAQIFKPFTQGASVGLSGGFGLGLSSVANLTALMGGNCGLRPGSPRGAAFYIRLADAPQDGLPCAA